MARSHVARHRPGQVPAGGPAARPARLVPRLVAVATAGACAALPLLAGQADAQQAARARSVTAALALTVTSVSPAYAKQGNRVTITGLVKNLSGSAASGLSVRLLSSTTPLGSRQDLENFAAGNLTPAEFGVRTQKVGVPRLGAGQSWRWTVSLPASSLRVSCFGVYPLIVRVSDAALQTARDAVPLPYWPAAKPAACPGQTRPRPYAISWIWPLIDTPHQDACAGLIGNRLAATIAPDGRLGYLLAVGSGYAASARLTWAIDPALLDSVRAMKQPYRVGGSALCRGGQGRPASPDAARWLAGLVRATAGHPVFVTPYADVDVAALIRRGKLPDLGRSFADGDQVAHEILGRGAIPVHLPAGSKQLAAIAWPPGGVASRAMLTYFAHKGIGAVVLAAPTVTPVTYTPGAVTTTLTDIGRKLHVLLADRSITALLGTEAAASRDPGAIFGVRQLYLAETAMIAAERPGNPRPVVVAPPRRWHPSRSLASGLLAETVHAPWLKPSTVSQIVAMKPSHIYGKLTVDGASGQISKRLLHNVSRLDHEIALLQSIRVNPDPALDRAIFGIESSSWRGGGAKNARAMLARTSRYVDSQLRGLSIRSGGGKNTPYHVTFGGKTSTVNVVIRSKLHYPVEVGLQVQSKKAKVTGVPTEVRVPALSYSAAVKLTVHVKANQGRITLRLIAPKNSPLGCHPPLPCHPLPALPLIILVHPTDFGTVALVIIAVALAVFVLASAFRAIRHGRPIPPAGSAQTGAEPPDQPDPAEPEPEPSQPPGPSGEPPGFADLGNRAEHIDSVGADRSELAPAGPALTAQEPAAPSRPATEERR